MSKSGGIIQGLLIFCVAAVFIDSALPYLFKEVNILQDFSFVDVLTNLLYILAGFVGWIAYTIQRITVGDFISPLNLLIRMLMSLAFIFIGGAVDLFFDLVVLPFNILADLAATFGVPTTFTINEGGVAYIHVDLATFTIRVGFKLSLFGNGARTTFQISMMGASELITPNKGFTFPESGFIGVYARLRLAAAGVVVKSPAFDLEIEAMVVGLVDAVFKNVGSAESIYQEILDALKKLGWI